MQLAWKQPLLLMQLLVLAAATEECEKESAEPAGSSLLQKQLLVHETAGAAFRVTHPWDKHIFVVGTHHKAGSQLLRNIMAHFFDILGATVSCQYDGHGDSVTSLNRENECTLFPAPIRFHNHISKDAILQMKKEAKDMKGDLRGVMIVRDPLEMVASSYCYHHRGAEPHNPMQKGIPEMGPEEGVPEMAKRMLHVIRNMAEAYEVSAPHVLVVRYEHVTHSPEHFDASVEKIMEFLFGDEITELQKSEIRRAVRVEDLHRASDLGISAMSGNANHTNDEADMEAARAALLLTPADLYAEYVKYREVLGYS